MAFGNHEIHMKSFSFKLKFVHVELKNVDANRKTIPITREAINNIIDQMISK